MKHIEISLSFQKLLLFNGKKLITSYKISSSKYGKGTKEGSFQTPCGNFRIYEKIGGNCQINTQFSSRIKMSEKEKRKELDKIVSRILWLDGLNVENKNTYERYIYIHGTDVKIEEKKSLGCIRMSKEEIAELFAQIPLLTPVKIS